MRILGMDFKKEPALNLKVLSEAAQDSQQAVKDKARRVCDMIRNKGLNYDISETQ